jgi:tetratricopeptide (TPR) repeat protein
MTDSSVQALLDRVAQAFDRKDYRSATATLKELWQLQPENPQVQLYRGRLYEVAGKFEQANATYKQLLKAVPTPKIMAQARQGLDRVLQLEKEQRQREIALSVSAPNQDKQGILILEAIAPETRSTAAQAFSRILRIDAYTARMHIPNRGWRMYRMGPIGEMALYGQQLRAENIPAFWVTEESLSQPRLVQVQFVIDAELQPRIMGTVKGDRQEIQFDWSEVTDCVQGSLPMFDRLLEVDLLRREYSTRSKKEGVTDYIAMIDLHLKSQNTILRFCDRTYDFHQGYDWHITDKLEQTGVRSQWNYVMNWIKTYTSNAVLWNDFTPFGETAIEFPHLLKSIDPGFYLYGQEDSRWNPAFHLYSVLGFGR